MLHKDHLVSYFPDHACLNDVKQAEMEIDIIFDFLGIERGNMFIRSFAEHIKEERGEFNFIDWFLKPEKAKLAEKATLPLKNAIIENNKTIKKNYEIAKESANSVLSSLNNIDIFSSENDVLSILENSEKEINKTTIGVLTKTQQTLRQELIREKRNNVISSVEEALSKKISYDTAFHGKKHHAIFDERFVDGRYKRSAYDTFCSPRKNLIDEHSRLNEGSVTCYNCLKIILKIINQ